jgi:small subunit ribosomal protein S9
LADPRLPEIRTTARTTGRRKTSIARVRLALGTGQYRINGRTLEEYFPRETLRTLINQPFEAINAMGRYDVHASLVGGGVAGQAGALRHGIARALQALDPAQRPPLKRAGLLTRDSREVERKKYGQRGARARFQFSKR